MTDLAPEVEQQLASMGDGEWQALTARLRAPDTTEQLRAAASKHVPADQLDAVMGIVSPTAFVRDGQVDEALVRQHFGALFGAQQHQWGQQSGQTPGGRPGDVGRAALAKRHGGQKPPNPTASNSGSRPGQRGRAALAQRHGGQR